VKVKQEPGTEDEICSFSGAVKQEKTEDGRRSACMLSSPESSLTPPLSASLHLESELDALASLENHVKTEPADTNESCKQSGLSSLVNGKSPIRSLVHRSSRIGGDGNSKMMTQMKTGVLSAKMEGICYAVKNVQRSFI